MGQEYIVTYSGKKFFFDRPTPESICIEDIAHALSQLCRWTGHSKRFYSVAEHSFRVSVECPKHPLRALLHDASEAYIADISRPLKVLIGPLYRPIEERIENAIYARFGLKEATVAEMEEVKRIDNVVLATEARDLMGFSEEWMPKPLTKTIQPMGPLYAEMMFLERFKELTR